MWHYKKKLFVGVQACSVLVSLYILGGLMTKNKNAPQSKPSLTQPPFVAMLKSFPFDKLNEIIGDKERVAEREILLNGLAEIALNAVIEEPYVPVNSTCRAPKPLDLSKIECTTKQDAFTGKRKTPARIGHMIQFGYDVDTLEIHLHEIYDVVDYIFLIESTISHKGKTKPLVWEMIKKTPRFSKFQDKVVHFIMDDSHLKRNSERSDIFQYENLQEKLRWQYFLEWNEVNRVFKDDDVIGFGDTDEIPSRENIQLLKHCVLRDGKVDIGIWFPLGLIDQAFQTDFPVPGHPYTLGDPTFMTIKRAMEQQLYPNRGRGSSGNFLIGGAHFSNYLYAPNLLLKQLSASEYNGGKIPSEFINQGDMKKFAVIPGRTVLLEELDEYDKEVVYFPWFYDCNRDRFPSWERDRSDPRITPLH